MYDCCKLLMKNIKHANCLPFIFINHPHLSNIEGLNFYFNMVHVTLAKLVP